MTRETLMDTVVVVLREHHGNDLVARHRIIDIVEQYLRKNGLWEASDNSPSSSTDPKSIGRANIDWRITDLKRDGRLGNPSRNMWRVKPGT
jgi:hypothetical protein